MFHLLYVHLKSFNAAFFKKKMPCLFSVRSLCEQGQLVVSTEENLWPLVKRERCSSNGFVEVSDTVRTNLWGSLCYLHCPLCLIIPSLYFQRRNFTLAFQAAESVGIKSTLVSACHKQDFLQPWALYIPLYKRQLFIFQSGHVDDGTAKCIFEVPVQRKFGEKYHKHLQPKMKWKWRALRGR